MKKRILAIFLAFCAMLVGTVPVYATDLDTVNNDTIELRYEAVWRVAAGLSIKSGIAYPRANYQLKSLEKYDYTLTLTLESSFDKKAWDEVMSWTSTPTETNATFEKQRAVTSGTYYRTTATLEVYTKDGKYVESAEANSIAVAY